MKTRQHLTYRMTGLILAILCWTWVPAQAHAARTPADAKALKSKQIFRDCRTCPDMVVIPAGSFSMGSPNPETGRAGDEGPVHQVHVATFALGKTEITRGQFAAFVTQTRYSTGDKCSTLEDGKVGERAGDWRELSHALDDSYPVGCVNWNDARAYAQWLSRATGKNYRLPTEAEWEYAARGNSSSARYWGDGPEQACANANTADQTAQAQIQGASSWTVHKCMDGFAYSAPAGSFKANAFGLNDMLGNVWEWTEDSYHDSYSDAPADGSAWQGDGTKHVLRGGSWNSGPRDARAAVRNSYLPELRFSFFGFRLARTLP